MVLIWEGTGMVVQWFGTCFVTKRYRVQTQADGQPSHFIKIRCSLRTDLAPGEWEGNWKYVSFGCKTVLLGVKYLTWA